MKQEITERELDVLLFIESYKNKYGFSPSIREISEGVYLAGTYSVQRHIIHLSEKGYITYIHKKPRTINVIRGAL